MRLRRWPLPSYEMLRRRMIRETEASLLSWLERGDKVPRIPTMEVDKGVFHPRFAAEYWADRIGLR